MDVILGLLVIFACCVLPIAAPIMWVVRRRARRAEREILASLSGDIDLASQPPKRKLKPQVIRFESNRTTNYINLIFVAIALTYVYYRGLYLADPTTNVDAIEWYKLGGITAVALPMLIYQIRILNRATIRFDLNASLIHIGRGSKARAIPFAQVTGITLKSGAKMGLLHEFGFKRRIVSITLVSGESIEIKTLRGSRESLDRQFLIVGHKIAEALRGEGAIFAQTMRQYNLARNFSETHPYVYTFYDPDETPLADQTNLATENPEDL